MDARDRSRLAAVLWWLLVTAAVMAVVAIVQYQLTSGKRIPAPPGCERVRTASTEAMACGRHVGQEAGE